MNSLQYLLAILITINTMDATRFYTLAFIIIFLGFMTITN